MDQAWIVVRESLVDGPEPAVVSRTPAPQDVPVTVGREGRVPLGVGLPDPGISRVALTVTASPGGWTIADTSRNGVIVQPWGLAANRVAGTTRICWPLIAVRVLGSDPGARHWVLLECDAYLDRGPEPGSGRRMTIRSTPPKPLTPAETEAIAVVFGSTVAWPPPTPAAPLQLKQAGRILGVTASAVKVRLEGARAKAEALGLERQVRVTDPDYVHVLVAAGYVRPPAHRSAATPAPEQE